MTRYAFSLISLLMLVSAGPAVVLAQEKPDRPSEEESSLDLFDTDVEETDQIIRLELSPGEKPEKNTASTAISGPRVIFIGSDQMGSGDPELGRILMKNFICTLTELNPLPDSVLFVNAGVKLACSDSEVIEALEKLACNSVDVASCGLCLDFFNLKGDLAVGRSTNMLDIVKTLRDAASTIRP